MTSPYFLYIFVSPGRGEARQGQKEEGDEGVRHDWLAAPVLILTEIAGSEQCQRKCHVILGERCKK